MENTNIQSALEILNKPEAVYQFVTGESVPTNTSIPNFTLEEEKVASELLVGIVEGLSEDNETFEKAYRAIQEKNEVVTRSGLGELINYSNDAYKFVSENWDKIFFLLMYMNNKGYFDKLKNYPTLKTFFKTLFDE